MVGTTTLGMASIAAAVTAGMVQVYAAFNFANVGLQFGLVFQQMVGTATLGMAAIVAVVTVGMAAINAAIAGGMGGILGFWAANWATVISIVQGRWIGDCGRRSRVHGLTAGRRARRERAGSWPQCVMPTHQMVQAWNGGMQQVVGAVRNGLNSAVAAARGFVGQFGSVGRLLMEGLRTGIMAMAGLIASAAAAVVRGALAAARAAGIVKSPSKAFMEIGAYFGEGMAIGIEQSADRVARAAADMVNSAVGAADKMSGAFAGDQWASDFSAKVEQSFGELDPTMSNKDVVGQLRALRGDVGMTSGDAAIVAQLKVLIAVLGARGGATGVGPGTPDGLGARRLLIPDPSSLSLTVGRDQRRRWASWRSASAPSARTSATPPTARSPPHRRGPPRATCSSRSRPRTSTRRWPRWSPRPGGRWSGPGPARPTSAT
jgi:hypothetical protein